MSIVKDMNLAESGLKKINWVKSYMPVLSAIGERFKKEQPFAGKTIAMSIHLEAKTAYLALTLAAGGHETEQHHESQEHGKCFFHCVFSF